MLVRSAFLFAALLALPATCVQNADLVKFFESSNGLSMSNSDAATLAGKNQKFLTACGVTIQQLQELRDTMYKTSSLDMSLSDVKQQILPLAYQHVDAKDLAALYSALYSSSKVDLAKSAAQTGAMSLAKKHAEPYLLGPLFQVLYSSSGVDLSKSEAQTQAVTLTYAGADAATLKSEYVASKSKYGKDAALDWAIKEGVKANLAGTDQRYAKDGKLYTGQGFQDYYKSSWLSEWNDAPREKRTAPDGKDYYASEFKVFFGDNWNSYWTKAKTATQQRIASDGSTYTLDQFVSHYGSDKWQATWFDAYEILDSCAGLNHDSCDKAAPKCEWKWNGDWTSSCVVKPLQEALIQV